MVAESFVDLLRRSPEMELVGLHEVDHDTLVRVLSVRINSHFYIILGKYCSCLLDPLSQAIFDCIECVLLKTRDVGIRYIVNGVTEVSSNKIPFGELPSIRFFRNNTP